MQGRNRRLWALTRLTAGAAMLAILVWRIGIRPFLDPLQRIDEWSLVAAAGIALLTTVCCAWRWTLVSRSLGSELPLGTAVTAYYQSQFLNTVLPGGVLGDVHRAVRRGRDVGRVGHAVRIVAWERTAGQAVQIVLTMIVLLVLPSPVRSFMPIIVGSVGAIALMTVLMAHTLPRHAPSALVGIGRALIADLRVGVLARQAWPGVVLASTVVVAGHAATFLVAARVAGSTASPIQLLPLALLVMLATALPTNIAGWGPREGGAAWVFALAGLGVAEGVGTAVVYGVLAFVATLPGAAVLVVTLLRPEGRATGRAASSGRRPDRRGRAAATVALEGATRA